MNNYDLNIHSTQMLEQILNLIPLFEEEFRQNMLTPQPGDKAAAYHHVNVIYKELAGKAPDHIFWCDSWITGCYALSTILKRKALQFDKAWNPRMVDVKEHISYLGDTAPERANPNDLETKLEDAFFDGNLTGIQYPDYPKNSKMIAKIKDQVDPKVFHPLLCKIFNDVIDEREIHYVLEQIKPGEILHDFRHHMCLYYYSYMTYKLGLTLDGALGTTATSALSHASQQLCSRVECFHLANDYAILCAKPITHHYNDKWQLHHDKEAAVQYADGINLHLQQGELSSVELTGEIGKYEAHINSEEYEPPVYIRGMDYFDDKLSEDELKRLKVRCIDERDNYRLFDTELPIDESASRECDSPATGKFLEIRSKTRKRFYFETTAHHVNTIDEALNYQRYGRLGTIKPPWEPNVPGSGHYQQGEILIEEIPFIPQECEKFKTVKIFDTRHFIQGTNIHTYFRWSKRKIWEQEQMGLIFDKTTEDKSDWSGNILFDATHSGALICHPRHGELTLPPACYEINLVWDAPEIRIWNSKSSRQPLYYALKRLGKLDSKKALLL